MPSYYNSVKGTIDSGKTARSGDIHLIQSSIQDAMQRMIVDMFGTGFILGESEDALKLYPTNIHIDQSNNNDEDNISSASFLDTYFRQPITIEKSSIETIRVKLCNLSNITTTIYAEIRDSDFELIQETNATLEPTLESPSLFTEVDFNFNKDHLPVGLYYFVLRPVDISATDLTISGDETPYDTIYPDMFRVQYDIEGQYSQGLEASLDGDTYLDANLLDESLVYDDNGDIIDNNPDLIFEHVYSSGNTYLITNGSAVVLGEKVYPLDTHVTIDGPSTHGDRTDLVTLTTDGRLNVIKGNVYNGEKVYPTDDTGLKIAYITTYRYTLSTAEKNAYGTLYQDNITTYNQRVPSIEQGDENNMTRHRDIIERIRRLEKKIDYQMLRNSPVRIKYNCVVDPILANNGVDDYAATRGEGTYNVSSTEGEGQTTITSNIAKNYAWSIIEDNYTYSNLTQSSQNIQISLWDTVTTKTKPSKYSSSTKGAYLIWAKAEDLTEANTVKESKALPGLNMQIQIKKGGTLKKTYDIKTNKNGEVALSIWSAALTVGSYDIYLIHNNTQVKAKLTIKNDNENIKATDVSPHTGYSTVQTTSAGKVTHSLPDGVIAGNDSFYTENAIIDTDNGEIRVKKVSNSGQEYITNTLLKDQSTYESKEVQFKINSGSSMTSEYPMLHFKLERDTYIKTITPYISGFQNMESFGILIFKNDSVFDMVDNTRHVVTKYIQQADTALPTIYDSGYKSLNDLVKQSNQWKILKNQVDFNIDMTFDAGTYSLMIYGKVDNTKSDGVIKIKQYHTLHQTSQYGIATKSIGSSKLSKINMDTSNLTDWSFDVAIKQKPYSYYDKATIISKPINTGLPITACNISKNLIIPEGCDADLYVTNDGANYIKANANNKTIKFTGDNNTFRWKLVLYATTSQSPKLKFDPNRQYAISFTLSQSIDYVEYEDYHRCYETPLINANAVTRTFTSSPSLNSFSQWEFARIYMEDEDLQSKIDICIGYDYDDIDTNVTTPKAEWSKGIFFSTIFANLSLEDFSRKSVDYSNYDGDVEYDEYNYPFHMDSEYVKQSTGGNALASPDTNTDKYRYGNINSEDSSAYDNINTYFSIPTLISKDYQYYDNDGESTQKYAGMHIIYGPYYEVKSKVVRPTDGSAISTYSPSDVILGVSFKNGLGVDENCTSVTLGIIPYVDPTKHANPSNYSTTDNENNETKFFPPNTFEVVLAVNRHGEIEENDAIAGKAYTISKPLIHEEYNEVSISFIDDLEGFEASDIYSIGIRAKDPTDAILEGESLGLGRITTSTYNIRPYTPYTYTGKWNRLAWKNLSGTDSSGQPKCRAFSIYELGRKDAWTNDNRKVFYPINYDYDNINVDQRILSPSSYDSVFNNGSRPIIWRKHKTAYRKLSTDNGEWNHGNASITRNGSSFTTVIANKGKYTVADCGNEICFDLAPNVTGQLFKIETDIPFTVYDLIDIQYTMFTEYYVDGNENDWNGTLLVDEQHKDGFLGNTNVRQEIENGQTYTYRTDGSFSKGEIYIDFYDTTDTTGDPVESFPLPAWGRVATQSTVADKTINAWFKKHSSSTKIRAIVLRRADPRGLGDKLPHIKFILNNILLFNTDQQLALGPQMQMRIYPEAMNDISNTRIRKYGAIYRLK